MHRVRLLLVSLVVALSAVLSFASPALAASHPFLQPGTSDPAVAELQADLNRWNNTIGGGYTALPQTGYFGNLTEQQVLGFQRTNGIPTTGNVGPLTWAALDRYAGGGSPAPAPRPQPQPQPSRSIQIVTEPGVVYPGDYASVAISTSPSRSCSITVIYYSGPSRARGLYPQTTNANGYAAWAWKVGTRTYAGNWPVIITCGNDQARTVVSVQ